MKENRGEKVIVSEPVFDYLKPTIYFMKMFGLAPVSHGTFKKHHILEKSSKYLIFSFAIAFVLSAATVLGIFNDATSIKSLRMKLPKQRYVVISDIGIVILSVVFGIFTSPYKTEQLLNIFKCLHKINEIVDEPKHLLKKEKTVAFSIGMSVYVIFALIIALDIVSWMERIDDWVGKMDYFKNYACFYALYFIVITQEISYCNLTYYVKMRLVSLNRSLTQEIYRKVQIFHGNVFESKLQKPSSLPARNVAAITATINENHDEQRIMKLMKVHRKIYTTVNLINDCFGYPLLFIMISCLLHLVITPFLFITNAATNNVKPLFIILQIVWISTHLMRLLIIVEPAHRCLEESERTNPLIVHLLSIKIDEKAIKQKLQVFALQGQLCKLNFSSCSIVNIRRSILASIASAVTTYLVILIQLNN